MSDAFSDSRPFRYRRATRLGRALELIGMVVLVLIFIWVAVDRIWPLRIEAERINLLHTEAAIQLGLGTFVSERAVQGRFDEIIRYNQANPVLLLGSVPSNYVGELSAEEGEKVDAYHWYFDRTNRQLVYVVGHPDHFSTPLPGRARALFQLVVSYQDNDGNGRFDQGSDNLTEIRLARVAPFQWVEP